MVIRSRAGWYAKRWSVGRLYAVHGADQRGTFAAEALRRELLGTALHFYWRAGNVFQIARKNATMIKQVCVAEVPFADVTNVTMQYAAAGFRLVNQAVSFNWGYMVLVFQR
jgi:hypothetical protein